MPPQQKLTAGSVSPMVTDRAEVITVQTAQDRASSRRCHEECPGTSRRTNARTSHGSVGAIMHNFLHKGNRARKVEPQESLSRATFEGAEASDPIDRLLLMHVMTVEKDLPSHLKVRKLGPGKYCIDGRTVCIRCRPHTGSEPVPSRTSLELLAREQGSDEGKTLGEEMALTVYLSSAANVSASLRGRSPGAPAVARLPKDKRLTFSDSTISSSALESTDVFQRCESMKKACEEAQLREWAAEAYENGVAWPSVVRLN